MTLAVDLFLVGLGVLGLWGGAVLAVSGAVDLSERYGVSQGFVGLAILAVGTDLPELVVALSGSAQQLGGVEASGVIIGSALGSAIAQGTLVLGLAGAMRYLPVAPRLVQRDGAVLVLAIALVAFLALDERVSRGEGAVLLLVYAIYLVALLQTERRQSEASEPLPEGRMPAPISIALGLVMVSLGAHVAVTEVIAIAGELVAGQTLLGVLVIGVGTSLPELALSLRAATRGRATLAVGNVIGSNVFDLLVPVGVAAALYPLTVARETILIDLPALAITTLALVFFLLRRRGLQRREAFALLGLYAAYALTRVVLT